MTNLRSLSLFCNDPEEAAKLLTAAESGDLDAQYGIGLCYAEGRGVKQDEARSFVWLTLAHEQGDDDALMLRNIVAATMSDEQFEQVDALLETQRKIIAVYVSTNHNDTSIPRKRYH